MLHTFVISDLHLCEALRETTDEGLWMRFRQKTYFPDQDFFDLVGALLRHAPEEEKELVLAGDIIDFDAPSIVDGEPRFNEKRTEEASAERLNRILDDHPLWLQALGRWVQSGHGLVYVIGNHDTPMFFPLAQEIFRKRVGESLGNLSSDAQELLRSRIRFQTWFYTTPTRIHIEHGNQYDRLCSYFDPTYPLKKDGKTTASNMGSLLFRHLACRLGFFNPHADTTYFLSFSQYLLHWFRYYLLTTRSIFLRWLHGTGKTFIHSWRPRTRFKAEDRERMIQASAQAYDLSEERIRAHVALFEEPADDLYSVVRELWLDRLFLAGLFVGTGVLAWIFSSSFFLTASFLCAAFFLLHERYRTNFSFTVADTRIASKQRAVARLHGAKAIVFGHTHRPFGCVQEGIFYGNSGTWAPAFHDVECTRPVLLSRPFVWLTGGAEASVTGGLYLWRDQKWRLWPSSDSSRFTEWPG